MTDWSSEKDKTKLFSEYISIYHSVSQPESEFFCQKVLNWEGVRSDFCDLFPLFLLVYLEAQLASIFIVQMFHLILDQFISH